MNFTSHNILLNNGTYTMRADRMPLAKSALWTSIEKTLSLFTSAEERAGMRAVDLGCLEGGYSVELARMGLDTLGIEAREESVQKCNYVKDNVGLPNLHFAMDDVRNLGKYGKFDVTLCYGLLYHLNDPVSFLKTVSECTTKILFLNTHFAADRDTRYELGFLNRFVIAPFQKRINNRKSPWNFRLSPIQENEGYSGRWFREWSKGTRKEKVEKLLWASYNNDRSFWLQKKDLTRALHAAGFTSVFEQFDFTGDLLPHDYTEKNSRTMFVAIKHQGNDHPAL